MAKVTSVKISSAGCCSNYNAGSSPLYQYTLLLPSIFIFDRALQTVVVPSDSRERHTVVVLSLFSRYETPRHCTQGRNHFYLMNVAHELKLATPLKWAACELPLKHYFSIIIRGSSIIFAGGIRKVTRGRFKRRGRTLAGLTLRWHCVQEDLWQRSRRNLIWYLL